MGLAKGDGMTRLMIALAVGALGFSAVSQGHGLAGPSGGVAGRAVRGPLGAGPHPAPNPNPNPCGGETPAC